MPFVQRNQEGKIIGLFNRPQEDMPIESLLDDNAEVIAFRNPPKPLRDRLKAILKTLPDSLQAQFGQTIAMVNWAIENNPHVATLELQALTLPPELESIRSQMLQEIDNG
jgi:hypothetical protein